MKKFALILSLCLFLAGCGAGENAPVEENVEAPVVEEQVEVPNVEEEAETPAEENAEIPAGLDVGGSFIGSASME